MYILHTFLDTFLVVKYQKNLEFVWQSSTSVVSNHFLFIILVTLLFDSEVTLIEEIKWKSLLRLLFKMLMGFIVQCSCITVWMSVSRNANLPSKNFINFAVKMAHWIQKDMNTVKHSANCRLEWLCWNRNWGTRNRYSSYSVGQDFNSYTHVLD